VGAYWFPKVDIESGYILVDKLKQESVPLAAFIPFKHGDAI